MKKSIKNLSSKSIQNTAMVKGGSNNNSAKKRIRQRAVRR